MRPSKSATVHIVDDDAAVRGSLHELMTAAGYGAVEYASAAEFLAAAPADGCLVLDLRMEGLQGLDLQQILRERGSDLPVIVLTGHGDVPAAVRALKQGAWDFLEKPYNGQYLLARIAAALEQQMRQRQADVSRGELAGRIARLTSREREVFELLAAGWGNKQVAQRLGIAERTVEFHRAHILEKTGAASVAALGMLLALQRPDAAVHFLSEPVEERR